MHTTSVYVYEYNAYAHIKYMAMWLQSYAHKLKIYKNSQKSKHIAEQI